MWCRLTSTVSIFRARVKARTGVLKKRKEKDPSACPVKIAGAPTKQQEVRRTKKRLRELRKKMRLVRVSLTERLFIPPRGRVPLMGPVEVLGLCPDYLSLPADTGPGRRAKGPILFYFFRFKYFFGI
jgi:hypothetical protein